MATNKPALNKEIEQELAQYPPRLRKLLTETLDNIEINSIADACEVTGANYTSIRQAIYNARKKGLDYNELLRKALNNRNLNNLIYVDNKVTQEALQGNMRASKLFYQRTKAIDSSGAFQVNIQNNINTMNATPQATQKPIDIDD